MDVVERAVILAGGRGTRLAPYTTILPKPLLPVGEVPILEIVLRQLRAAGVCQASIAVGYLHELLRAYFGTGEKVGLRLDYSLEDQPLGTAGPLALVPNLTDTFLVMNGDLLTTIDYRALVKRHRESGAAATIAVFSRSIPIDLGIVELDPESRLTNYIEKPTLRHLVSMGIYVLEPRVLSYIEPGLRLDLPDLMRKLMKADELVIGYQHAGYWMDLGRKDDYERAVADFDHMREQLLPEGKSSASCLGARSIAVCDSDDRMVSDMGASLESRP